MGLKFNISPLQKINLASHITKALPVTLNKVKKITTEDKTILKALGYKLKQNARK